MGYKNLLILLCFLFSCRAVAQTVVITGNDAVCAGQSTVLHAEVSGGSFGATSYTFETFNYTPEAYTSGIGVQFEPNQDDKIAGPFPIGFTFCFFNQSYTQFYIGSNGWIGFSYNIAWTTFTAQSIPSPNDMSVPRNCIMAPWQDWWPGWISESDQSGTNVYYYTTGIYPNQKLVVYWTNCPLYNCRPDKQKYGTFQIVLNEQSNVIENHIQKKPNCSSTENATQGVQNFDGNVAFTATGRNCQPWTAADESTRFVPSGVKWYKNDLPPLGIFLGYGPDLTVSPTTATTYYAEVGTCNGASASDFHTVTDYPIPHLANPETTKAICSGSNAGVNLIPDVPGQNFSWTSTVTQGTVNISNPSAIPGMLIDDQLTNPGTSDAIIKYSITPHANGCDGPIVNYFVTVHPTPHLMNPESAKGICSGSNAGVNLLPDVTGQNFSWVSTVTQGTVNISNPSAQPGIFINDQLTNPGTSDAIIKYAIIPHANGCAGPSVDYFVTVHPTPHLMNPESAKAICSGSNAGVNLLPDVTGGNFSWVSTATQGTVNVSSPSAQPGILIDDQLTNPGTSDAIIKYSITPHANGCAGPMVDYFITVHPTPHLMNPESAKAICSGSLVGMDLLPDVTGQNFSWTSTVTQGTVNVSNPSAQPGILINDQLTNPGTSDAIIKYAITPHANGCAGTMVNYFVTVHPTPHLMNPESAKAICSGSNAGMNLLPDVTGENFSWVSTVTQGMVNILNPSSQPGILIDDQLTNPGTSDAIIKYAIAPHANGCDGPIVNYFVTVHPVPHLMNPESAKAICSGSNAGVNLLPDVTGENFSWVSTVTQGTVNISNPSAQPGLFIDDKLTNPGTSDAIIKYAIAPHANGCNGPNVNYFITVHPTPHLVNTESSKILCSTSNAGINLLPDVTGQNFSWTSTVASGTVNISNPSTQPGIVINDILTNPGTFDAIIKYSIIPHANGCYGPNADYFVTVRILPVVALPACFDLVTIPTAQPFILHGGTPLGTTGIYSGEGVTFTAGQYQFNPAAVIGSLPKSVTITYTYTNSYACPSSDTKTIIIMDPPPFQCENPMNPLVDVRTSQPYKSYNTYRVGIRCWMSQNLDYGIELDLAEPQSDNCEPQKYCLASVPDGCISGGFYQWDELMQYTRNEGSQGLCPPGWHVPTSVEWQEMLDANQGNGLAGGPLKDVGFNALLNGISYLNNPWSFAYGNLTATMFWTSTLVGSKPVAHGLNSFNPSVSIYESSKANAFPVRCVKD